MRSALALLCALTCLDAACSSDNPAPPAATPPEDAGVDTGRPRRQDAGADAAEAGPDNWGKVDAGATSTAIEIDLGTVDPQTEKTFDIPSNALGFNVVVSAGSVDETLGITTIKAPSGQVVHSNMTPFNGVHATSMTFTGMVAAAGVPQSNHPSAMPKVETGKWTVTFAAKAPVTAKVRVQTTPDGAYHGGVLDMHLYVPLGLTIDGETATKDNYSKLSGVRTRIDRLDPILRQLYGLRTGNITFHLLDARYVQLDDFEVFEAFAESAGTEQALHLVFSEATDNQQWWGIAGGIPGSSFAGSQQSAVALATISRASAAQEAHVLAHEIGHFLGLNHTTEFEDNGYDPLEDTPQCPGMTFENFMRCPDFTNIMQAASSAFGKAVTSPLQRRVVQGSPVYRAFLTGDVTTNGVADAPDFGALFGHPGRELTSAEAAILASMCGTRKVTSHPSAALTAIADDTTVLPIFRNAARRLNR